jgi:hypothetical protein
MAVQLTNAGSASGSLPAAAPGINVETHDAFADLVAITLNELGRNRFSDLASRITDYEVMSRILKRDKVSFETGTGLSRNVMVDQSKVASHNALYSQDSINIPEVMDSLTVPFRHSTTNYAFDKREITMNAGPQKIVDLVKTRRADAMLSLVELMEATFWGDAVVLASDKITPYSVNNWVAPSSGVDDGTFVAGGVNIAGGLTANRWANFADRYNGLSVAGLKDDLILKLRKAHRKIGFKSPVDIPDYRERAGDVYRIYCNLDVITALESAAEIQNDSLGNDLAPMDGAVSFRKNPIVYVPKLDQDETSADFLEPINTSVNSGVSALSLKNPIYMINWSVLQAFFLKGEFLRESAPIQRSDAHNTYQVHTDLSWNTVCTNRRKLGLFVDSSV